MLAVEQEIANVLESSNKEAKDSQAMTFLTSYQEMYKNQIVSLFDTIRQFESCHSARKVLYNRAHLRHDSESLTAFRSDLMTHLSTTIFVKDHRYKYQTEQYERLLSTLNNKHI